MAPKEGAGEMRKALLVMTVALVLAPLALGEIGKAREQYETRRAALGGQDVDGHYLLGLWCEKNDLAEEARMEFEKVVALSPDHEGARNALGYVKHDGRWLSHEEAMASKGLVKFEGTWMLPEEVGILTLPKSELERKRAAEAKTRGLLRKMSDGDPKVERFAMKAMEGIPDRYKVEPLAYGLRYPAEPVRKFAAAELGRIGDRRALRPLIHRSLLDPSEGVREAAVAAVKQFKDPNILAPYVKALGSDNQVVRINAEDAIGGLGEIIGVEYLVWRLRANGGGLSRSNIYLATQMSFIQDFDVEVAQTAFIADPIVGIVQEGIVLDVRVLATERVADIVERRVIRRSLKKLTGVDKGDDAGAWASWWKENKASLVKN
jgi:hypothetical protein